MNKKLIAFIAFLITNVTANANMIGTITGGIFSNPQPPCVGSVICNISGTGTQITFGTGSSSLSSTTNSFNAALDPQNPLATEGFIIGTLFFHNGTNDSSSRIDHVTLSFSTGDVTDNTDPNNPNNIRNTKWDNQPLVLDLEIINTPNTGDENFNADIVRILGKNFGIPSNYPNPCATPSDPNPFCNEFHVKEGLGTSVDIWGRLSSFDVVGFGSVQDPSAGFLSSSVPEPSVLGFLGIGFLGMFAYPRLIAPKGTTAPHPHQRKIS